MKNLLYLLAVIASVTFVQCDGEADLARPDTQASAEITPRSADMVTICHRQGNGTYAPLEVNVNAVAGHLGHGDYLPDADGDGYSAPGACVGNGDDCDDTDPTIYPGATEVPDDGIDQDCDGEDEITLNCRCFTWADLQEMYTYEWFWGWYNDIDANCQPDPLYQGINDIVLRDARKNGTTYAIGAGTIAYPNGSYNVSYSRFNFSTNQFEENCYWFVPYEDYLPCKLLIDQFLDELAVTHPEWDYCVRFP